MDIQQLRYVAALSQELHFQRAAKRVNVTQPTLSQGIKKLEEELKNPLFERSPQKVTLTQAGKKFIPRAIHILDLVQKSIAELQVSDDQVSGMVRIGIIPTICPYIMPDVILDVKKTAPKVVIGLYEETTSNVLENLKTGRLDLGLLALPINERSISSLSVCHEDFFLAVPSKNKLATKKQVTTKEVVKEQILILQEGHCFADQSLDYCKLSRHHPQVIFQGSSLTSVLKLTACGEGVTFVPKMAIENETLPGIKYVPFAKPKPTRDLGMIWRLTAPIPKAQQVLMNVIEKVLKEKCNS